MTKAGERDSLLAKEIHMGAIFRVDEFSCCLARAWVTPVAQEVTPSVCVTAEAPVTGASIDGQGIHREEIAREEIILSDLGFPISLPSKLLIKF